jgi:hypothetical protein
MAEFMPTPTVRVRFDIDRTAAILAGNSTFGSEHAYVDPAALTETQRKTLVGLNWKSDAYVLAGHKTVIASRETVNVPALLDEIAEHQREQEEKARQERRASYDRDIRYLREWLAKPDEKLILKDSWSPNHTVAGWVPHYRFAESHAEFQDAETAELLEQHKARKARLAVLAAEKTAEARALKEEQDRISNERHAQKKLAEEQKEQRRIRQLADWVDTHGTKGQKKRLIANLLPQDEILADMRKYAFSSLDAFGRYDRLTKTEVLEAFSSEYDVDDDDVDVSFNVEPATEATDEEFEALEKIGEIIRRAYPDAKVELLKHCGESGDAKVYSARKSVKVTIPFGDFEFTREYAAPLQPAS